MAHNDYKNKYFSILGDSISTLEWYSTPDYAAYYNVERKLLSGVLCPADTWWGQVIEHFGGELLVNNSFAGSTVTWRPTYEIESYACSDERTASLHRDGTEPDVIMIFMGINDWGYGVLPAPLDETQAGELSVFSVAYSRMLEKIQKNYPQAELWCLTLPIAKRSEGEDFPYCRGGVHIGAYCDVIRACAERYGCRIADLYRYEEPYNTLDEFHPDVQGMKTLADAVIEEIGEKKNG